MSHKAEGFLGSSPSIQHKWGLNLAQSLQAGFMAVNGQGNLKHLSAGDSGGAMYKVPPLPVLSVKLKGNPP